MPAIIDVRYGSVGGTDGFTVEDGVIKTNKGFKMTYIVLADNTSQTQDDIGATGALPQVGSLLRGCLLKDRKFEETDIVSNPMTGVRCGLWEVECEYSSDMKSSYADTTPKVGWGGEIEREVLERDIATGKRVTTTAGEPIFSEIDIPMPVLKITRQESYPFDPNTILLYVGRVNAVPFWGAPIGCVWMLPIEVEEEVVNGVKMCHVTYTFKFRFEYNYAGVAQANSWQASLLNQGYMYRPNPVVAPSQNAPQFVAGNKPASPATSVDQKGHLIKYNLDRYGYRLVNSDGINLTVLSAPPGSLNQLTRNYACVYPNGDGVNPVPDDVGGYLSVLTGSGGSWLPNTYNIVGYDKVGSQQLWILDQFPANIGAAGGLWHLDRAALYLRFYRYYPADFNALSLGPF